MPYDTVGDLPEQFDQYDRDAKKAALDTLNGCMYEGDRPEGECFQAAHMEAKRAGGGGGGGGGGRRAGGGGRQRQRRRQRRGGGGRA